MNGVEQVRQIIPISREHVILLKIIATIQYLFFNKALLTD